MWSAFARLTVPPTAGRPPLTLPTLRRRTGLQRKSDEIAPRAPSPAPPGGGLGLVSSVASLVFLDPHPLLLATYSDGTIRVWGVKGSPLKGLLILTFFAQAPKEACFWGGEEAEYPLLR